MLQFLLVDNPEYQPRMCRNCGGHENRKWWIDLCYQEEFYGHIYFCDVCFEQMAHVAKFVPEEKVLALQEPVPVDDIYVRIFDHLFGIDRNPVDVLRFLNEPKSSGAYQAPERSVPTGKVNSPQPNNVERPVNVSSSPKKLDVNFGGGIGNANE
jgi:hypothetical protein